MIRSILDNDLYKFTMQNAVLQYYPDASVEYRFVNRSPEMTFSGEYSREAMRFITSTIEMMEDLRVQPHEIEFLRKQCPYLPGSYLDYLREYRYDPNEINIEMSPAGALSLDIKGPWRSAIMWEVPLMATISESYFKFIDSFWVARGQNVKITRKGFKLNEKKCFFTDFGTRRRRSYEIQDIVVKNLVDARYPHFFGTSNVHFAQKYGTKPIGTMAHEWIMGVSGVHGIIGANRIALEQWNACYGDRLGFALSDTFGTDQFFLEFSRELSQKYDGVRHDSGNPFDFVDKVIDHYRSVGIDPATKMIIFSDSLNVDKAIALTEYCKNKIRCSFGIGTHFTNDFFPSKAMNIVIKMYSINGIYVVKLSDDFTKATGERAAVQSAMFDVSNRPGMCNHEWITSKGVM